MKWLAEYSDAANGSIRRLWCIFRRKHLKNIWTTGHCLKQIKNLREQIYKMTRERHRYARW